MDLILKVMQLSHISDQTVHSTHVQAYCKHKHKGKVKDTQEQNWLQIQYTKG